VSGAENGAERAEKLVSGSGAVSGTSEKREERERSAERETGNGAYLRGGRTTAPPLGLPIIF
jgi:hypothetical protein